MRITAHVGYDHPNGQRLRAGHTFVEAPADYDVTAEQYAAIVADPAIIVTKVHGDGDAAPTKAELLTAAEELGIEGLHARTKNADIAAAINAKRAEIEAEEAAAAAEDVARHGQGQTAAEQQALDERK